MNDSQLHKQQLQTYIASAFTLADWIYHDVRLDPDKKASERTAQRLQAIHQEHGIPAMFGVTGAWAVKAQWRLQDAYIKQGKAAPALIPGDMLETVSFEDDRKRAYVSAQQFISSVAADDLDMAEAIFNAASDASDNDMVSLMYSVLMLCIQVSTLAKRIR